MREINVNYNINTGYQKFTKIRYKQRYIARSGKYFAKPVSLLYTKLMTAVKKQF